MHIFRKTALLVTSSAILGLSFTPAQAQSRYGQSQNVAPRYIQNAVPFGQNAIPFRQNTVPVARYSAPVGRYSAPTANGQPHEFPKKYKNFWHRARGQKHIAFQQPAPLGQFQQWVDWEPEYQLTAGDQLDIVVSSAPELSRTLTVGPDGRVVMPMSRPIMAAGRTFGQVQNDLTAELGKQLRDPTIAVTPRAYSPSQIFVGGQVGQPGTYTLPGRIGAIEAIFMAGGFGPGAKTKDVAILRRAPNGGMMIRAVNIRGGILNIREYNDNLQLRRGDIIYVPRTTLAEVGTFVQALRQTFPVDLNISYTIGNFGGGGGDAAPAIPGVTTPLPTAPPVTP